MGHYSLYTHPPFVSFHHLVCHNAEKYPYQVAFQFQQNGETVNITYDYFKRNIETLTVYFQQQGLHRSRIAVLGENS